MYFFLELNHENWENKVSNEKVREWGKPKENLN